MRELADVLTAYLGSYTKKKKVAEGRSLLLGLCLLVLSAYQFAFIAYSLLGFFSAVRFLALVAAFLFLLQLALRYWRSFDPQRFSLEAAAAEIEHFSLFRGRLVAAFDLSRREEGGQLAWLHVRRTLDALAALPALPRPVRERDLHLGRAVLLLLILLVLEVLFAPDVSRRTWKNWFVSDASIIRYTLQHPEQVRRGGSLMVRAETDAYSGSVDIWHDGERYQLPLQKTAGALFFKIEGVHAELAFQIHLEKPGSSVSTRRIRVPVLYDLFVEKIRCHVVYPAYLRRSPKTFEQEPVFRIPAGSRLRIEGRANLPLAQAFLVRENDEKEKLTLQKRSFSLELRPRRSFAFHFALTATNGMSNREPIRYRIRVSADEMPRIRILEPQGDRNAGRSLRLPVHFRAGDDHGLHSLQLVYSIMHPDYQEKGSREVKTGGRKELEKRFFWDMNALPLSPGEDVAFFIRARDTAGQVSRSKTLEIHIPGLAEMLREREKTGESIQKQLSSLLKRQRENVKQSEAALKALKNRSLGKEERKRRLEQLAQSHKKMREESEKLEKLLKKHEAELADPRALAPESLKTIQKIRKYLREMDLQLAKPMQDLLDKYARQESAGDLEKLPQEEKKLEKQLKNMLKALERMALVRQMENADTLLENMSKEYEKLEKARQKQEKAAASTDPHKKLAELQKELKKQAEKIAEEGRRQKNSKLEELGRELASPEGEKLQSRIKTQHGDSRWTEMQESLRQAQKRNARLRKQLQARMQGQGQQAMNRLRSYLEQFFLDVFTISELIEQNDAYFDRTRSGYGKESRRFKSRVHTLLSRQEAVRQTVHKQREAYSEMMQGMMLDDQGIGEALVKLEKNLAHLLKELQNMRLYQAEQAFRSNRMQVNRLLAKILKFSENFEKMMANAQKQNSGQQSASMQALAEAQRQMDARMKRLMEKAAAGKLSAAEKKYLQKLARQQQQIREALSRSLRQGRQFLGDSESLLQDMEELEKELRKGRMNRKLYDRERKILKRLLQASRALEKQGMKAERKAEKAERESAESGSPDQLPDFSREQQRLFREMMRSREYSGDDRQVIRRYYQFLQSLGDDPENNTDVPSSNEKDE